MSGKARGIMIFGPAGAGKTTLGRAVAEELRLPYIDIDEYIWRQDTDVPFSALYPRQERIHRLQEALAGKEAFVMAGSMDSFHEHFDPLFALAVHLTADAALRLARIHAREQALLGARILPGGDLHERHQGFLADAASYDAGGGSMSLERHRQWAASLRCPVLALDGGADLTALTQAVAEAWRQLA